MKKLFDIPAYAVVELSGKRPVVVALEFSRDYARGVLQEYKAKHHNNFKIVKLEATKWIR